MSNQNTPIFDTHAAVKRLTEAGMPASQAEAVVQGQADVLAHNLANKRDIELIRGEAHQNVELLRTEASKNTEELRADISAMQQNIADINRDQDLIRKDIAIIHKDIAALRDETKKDLAALGSETKKDIELLRAELNRDLAQGLHRQSRFIITSLMGFVVMIMAFIEFRLLV